MTKRIAVYSPTLGPAGAGPSGERTILAATATALTLAGFEIEPILGTRLLDTVGDAQIQADLSVTASAEAAAQIERLKADPPALWYTYHSYYRCPDLVGPQVAHALGVPYVVHQPTLSPRRLEGPWAAFAKANLAAVQAADLLLWSTRRDLPALEAADLSGRLAHLPPFLGHLPPPPTAQEPSERPVLLAVAMMRPGDKLESYRRLAAALAWLERDWQLRIAGDGPSRSEIEAAFAPLSGDIEYLGALGPDDLAQEYAAADVLVWPGVREGVGMVYLEAQAHGLPVVAEAHPAQGDVVENRLAPPRDPDAFAALIAETLADRPARAAAARKRVETRHAPQAAAAILRLELARLVA